VQVVAGYAVARALPHQANSRFHIDFVRNYDARDVDTALV
jgi:hypothetical protein